eukprot:260719-Chlamydomonas_euryale.AAC.4
MHRMEVNVPDAASAAAQPSSVPASRGPSHSVPLPKMNGGCVSTNRPVTEPTMPPAPCRQGCRGAGWCGVQVCGVGEG